jgi:hypothetical protein
MDDSQPLDPYSTEFSPNSPCNPNRHSCTLCTGDKTNNIFFTSKAPGFPGRCILDEMSFDDVYWVLQKIPQAKADLIRITSDPTLLALAKDTGLIESPLDESERLAHRENATALPFYTMFRGNIDGSIR